MPNNGGSATRKPANQSATARIVPAAKEGAPMYRNLTNFMAFYLSFALVLVIVL